MYKICVLATILAASVACGDDADDGPTVPTVGPDGELVFTSAPELRTRDLAEVADTMRIEEPGFVGSLEVDLDIEHPRVFELRVALEHVDSGVRFDLVRSPLSTSNDIVLRLSDRAPVDVQDDVLFQTDEDGPAYDQPAYTPFEPLAFMAGESMAGTWRLIVTDVRTDESGVLHSWSLRVQAVDAAPATTVAMARPRTLDARIALGVTVDQRVRYRGATTVAVAGAQITPGAFTVIDDTSPIKTGVISFAGTELGVATLTFTGTSGAVDDSAEQTTEFVDSQASGMTLVSHLSPAQLGYPGDEGNDCWGWTDPLDGTEYAMMGLEGGLSFVSLADPANPVVLGTLDTHTKRSVWRDVKVFDDHAFIVSEAEGHGMQVFDLTKLRTLTGAPAAALSETAHFDEFGSAHNIAIDEQSALAYVVGANESGFADQCFGGLYMVDIRTPTQPAFVGCFAGALPPVTVANGVYPQTTYTHDVQCVVYAGPDARYTDHQLCFSSDSTTDDTGLSFFGIADVTNKSRVNQVARVMYPEAGFAHQGWLSEDHRTFFLNDEFDEFTFDSHTRTLVFDVADLENPAFIGAFENPSYAVGHNSYVVGGVLYMANYTSGLRVVDLNPSDEGVITVQGMQEVAFFDTFPGDDASNDGQGAPAFAGAWSTYPFFASGNILISDIDSGLFIVR